MSAAVNPARGEVLVETDNGDHVMCLDINAMCEIEESFGGSVNDLIARLGDRNSFKLADLRKIVWIGLRQRNEDLTELDAGVIMTAAGIGAIGKAIEDAFVRAFPSEDVGDSMGPGEGAPEKNG